MVPYAIVASATRALLHFRWGACAWRTGRGSGKPTVCAARQAEKGVSWMDDVLTTVRLILTTTPPRWQTLAASVPVDLLRRPPAQGEWSALDCLRHVLDTERSVFPVRTRAFLAGERFPAFDPDAQGSQAEDLSPSELATQFGRARAASLALYDTLTPADLSRTAIHAELGTVTLEEMLHEWAAHDLMHTVQAERALLQPFIARTGPWRFYFADHDVERH